MVKALKLLASTLLFLTVFVVFFQIPIVEASPDIYLKDSAASGVATNPGKLMDFEAPTGVDPAYFTTSSGIEYYWYSPPYVGTILGPKGHSFHLYYTADAATTVTVTVHIAVQPDGSGTPILVSSKSYPLETTSTVTHIAIPDVINIPETRLNGERIKLSLSSEAPITVYYDSIDTPCVLNYIPPSSPDFSVRAEPSSISIAQGSSGSSTINITSLNGFSEAVTLSYSWFGDAPSDVTVSLPGPVTPPPNGSATSELQVSAGVAATIGTFTLRVMGSSGAIANSTDIGIEITEATTATPPPRAGCIIATAAYGSELAPEVAYMRNVRDNMIGSNQIGRMLVDGWGAFYYSWSPPIAGWIGNSGPLKAIFRILLLPLIVIVHSIAPIHIVMMPVNPTLASVTAFLFAATLSVAVYVVAPVLAFRAICKRKFLVIY